MFPQLGLHVKNQVEGLLHRYWRRYALRGVRRSDNWSRLDLAYLMPDPWHLETPGERFRFTTTNRLIKEKIGRVTTILEIGCGEGLQTEALAELCDEITGIDISPRAIKRAQGRGVAKAHFAVGDLFVQPWANEYRRFDLVVACEVIYYLRDVEKTLSAMTRLGNHRVVTYFSLAECDVGQYVGAIPDIKFDRFRQDETEWTIAWW